MHAKTQDSDPSETQEWLEALTSVIQHTGSDRADFILNQLLQHAHQNDLHVGRTLTHTPYINTLNDVHPTLPDEEKQLLELNINLIRWNAIIMVMRAGRVDSSLGGHIATFASVATLFEVGFNYFFHANDFIYFQGHASPGIYARAFLEGRLTEAQLDGFRQEQSRKGLPSYPHPRLLPNFWQFPTVSMGLGPLMGIYQAQFLKYLNARNLVDTHNQKVWVFCGDGEMGEPESLGAINIAGREQLDNLIFVVNCNLQRLDGLVWGNGQIIQEYEGVFRGAGWNVLKVIWGSGWQELFAKDQTGAIMRRLHTLVDGEYQDYTVKGPAYFRTHFFGTDPELLALVADKSDSDLQHLQDGGHDVHQVYAAYQAARAHRNQPTVILAKTVKGYGMGASGEGKNIAHQAKKIGVQDLHAFVQRFQLPIAPEHIEQLPYLSLEKNSAQWNYLHERRRILGGYVPARTVSSHPLKIPDWSQFSPLLEHSGTRTFSSTMSFVRILLILLKDSDLKSRIVPIVADECRTFGMEGLFRQLGIYAPFGQRYEPEDRNQLMYYRESVDGQLLQEGISESGAFAAWIAAATSYANLAYPMIPFFIYYSMFGYQRFGDLVWASGDIMARGFVLGGTSGRTTLNGEGLQHQDGHNVLFFSAVPNCITYDPTFAYEVAVIVYHGLKRMYVQEESVFYYINLMNEDYVHPAMPAESESGIIKGLYLLQNSTSTHQKRVQLLGSGAILNAVIEAAQLLERDWEVAADVWSATSFNELRRDIESVTRYNRLHPESTPRESHVALCLKDRSGPVVAATDQIKLFADQIRSAVPNPYYVLGTNGFGRSDTRSALRDFFEVDAKHIVYTAIKALCDQGAFPMERATEALNALGIDASRLDPVDQ